LLLKASATSQEIAGYLNWSIEDIENIVRETPGHKAKFMGFAEGVMGIQE
jgi:hypothetical protein